MFEILLIILINISIAAIAGGYFMKYQAPKDKKMKYGLRTGSTQTSKEVWEYANRTCGKSCLIIGLICLLLGIPMVLFMYFLKGEYYARALSLIYVITEIIFLVRSVTVVLKEIKIKFDENGNPKESV